MQRKWRDNLFTEIATLALFLSGPLLVFWLCYDVFNWAFWISLIAALLGGTAASTVVAMALLLLASGGWALGFFKEEKPHAPDSPPPTK